MFMFEPTSASNFLLLFPLIFCVIAIIYALLKFQDEKTKEWFPEETKRREEEQIRKLAKKIGQDPESLLKTHYELKEVEAEKKKRNDARLRTIRKIDAYESAKEKEARKNGIDLDDPYQLLLFLESEKEK